MRLIGRSGEIKIGALVGESPLGKIISITEPNERYPKGMQKANTARLLDLFELADGLFAAWTLKNVGFIARFFRLYPGEPHFRTALWTRRSDDCV